MRKPTSKSNIRYDDTLHKMIENYPLLAPIYMSSMSGSPMEAEEIISVTAFLMSHEGRHRTGDERPLDIGSRARQNL